MGAHGSVVAEVEQNHENRGQSEEGSFIPGLLFTF